MIDDPHDFLDVKIRLVRSEGPILFKALEGIESRPGSRTRTLYFRQLAEMGLMMQEERMRVREPGLSSRPASALARDVAASATRDAVPLAAVGAPAPSAPAPAPTPAPVSAGPTPELTAVTPTMQASSARAPLVLSPQDTDRPAPRVVGQGSRRMLEGNDFA